MSGKWMKLYQSFYMFIDLWLDSTHDAHYDENCILGSAWSVDNITTAKMRLIKSRYLIKKKNKKNKKCMEF